LKPADSYFTNRSAALRESRHGENADLLVLISKAFYQSCSILYTAHGSLSDKDGSSAKQEVVRVLPLYPSSDQNRWHCDDGFLQADLSGVRPPLLCRECAQDNQCGERQDVKDHM
jgi:hypothetical protein